MSTRSIAGDLTPDLLQTSVWSDEQLVSADVARWHKVVTDAGIKLE